MWKSILLVICVVAICDINATPFVPVPNTDTRIIGGQPAEYGQFPFIVSIQVRRSHTCGGSIISEDYVLTAGHCCSPSAASGYYSIQYGTHDISTDENIIPVEKVNIHPNYDYGTIQNDISILTLQSKINFFDELQVQRVTLQNPDLELIDNDDCTLCGWGYDDPFGGGVQSNLLCVNYNTVIWQRCQQLHSAGGTTPAVTEKNVCAWVPEGGKGQCSGDSGGPLVVNDVQIGIVSWSVKPCTVEGYPGVFTNVKEFMSFITETVGVDNVLISASNLKQS